MKTEKVKVRVIRSLDKSDLASQLQWVLTVRYKWIIIAPAACLLILIGCFVVLEQNIAGAVVCGVAFAYVLVCTLVVCLKSSKWTRTLMAKEQPIDLDKELEIVRSK